jgi:hypothetical protein
MVVFALDRRRSFVLTGSAKVEQVSPERVTLTDVVPDANGQVWLSFHHIPGLRAYPSYVHLESAKDREDPLSHVCLRTHGPVPRVTLVWENP